MPLIRFTFVALLCVCSSAFISMGLTSDAVGDEAKAPISSRVLTTDAGERVLIQEVWIQAPVLNVWNAFVTSEGWTAWASPVAEVDLRAGGTIQTHYTLGATIGDAGTNVLHIVNYVPERMLTLRAELADNWPEVMKQDAGNLMNVILFNAVTDKETHIVSYGVGYRDNKEYEDLLNFFVPANEGLYLKLKRYLENGEHDKP